MTPKAREDAIGIGCAIGGAAFGQFVVGPFVGGYAPIAAGVGGALGWGLAKAVITAKRQAETSAREEQARDTSDAHEREFAERLQHYFGEGGTDERR